MDEDDVDDQLVEDEVEGVEVEEPEGQEPEDDQPEAEESPDEVVISIGDEPEEDSPQDSTAIRELRRVNREKIKENQRLQAEIAALKTPQKAIELGAKPTLEGCDFDPEKFESELTQWHARKREVEAKAADEAKAREEADNAWKAQLERHGKLKSELKVSDFEEAEAVTTDALSQMQLALIVQGADNSAQLSYALGRNPKKLAELAAIKDPVKFAFAVAKLETQLKVTPRKTAPLPERTPRGSAAVSGVTDSKLARLEAEADRTGDRSKLIAYKKQKSREQVSK